MGGFVGGRPGFIMQQIHSEVLSHQVSHSMTNLIAKIFAASYMKIFYWPKAETS